MDVLYMAAVFVFGRVRAFCKRLREQGNKFKNPSILM